MENWHIIDAQHAHCMRCGKIGPRHQLVDAPCQKCQDDIEKKAMTLVTKAEDRIKDKAITASATLLASLTSQGKSGKSMPVIVDTFMNAVGGREEFAKRMGEQFLKAHGGDHVTPEDIANGWELSPQRLVQWYELIGRIVAKVDEAKTLDVGSLDEAELDAILANLARKLITEDQDVRNLALLHAAEGDKAFCEKLFWKLAASDPDLEQAVLAKHGVITLDACPSKMNDEKKTAKNNNMEAGEYNPMKDEYQPEGE